MSALFSKPRIPTPPVAAPPAPPVAPQNSLLQAQLSQLGRRQGLVAALFGYKNPPGTSVSRQMSGTKAKLGE